MVTILDLSVEWLVPASSRNIIPKALHQMKGYNEFFVPSRMHAVAWPVSVLVGVHALTPAPEEWMFSYEYETLGINEASSFERTRGVSSSGTLNDMGAAAYCASGTASSLSAGILCYE